MIAVIGSELSFNKWRKYIAKKDIEKFKLIQAADDCRGRLFVDYIFLYDAYEIKDLGYIEEILKRRIVKQ